MDQDDLKENLSESDTWVRGLIMLLFIILYVLLYSLAEIVFLAVVVAQFVIKASTGTLNPRLLDLGYGISTYLYQIYLFLTFVSEERPFPFGPWPQRQSEAETGPEPVKGMQDDEDDEPHLGV